MKVTRSLLFVPAHKKDWVPKAIAAGPDGIILDLEDSVPVGLKPQAREIAVQSIAYLRDHAPEIAVYVRTNALETGVAGDDLEAIAIDGVTGLVLPKIDSPRDVIQYDGLTSHFERRNGVHPGTIEFIPSLESASAYSNCAELIAASVRVVTLFAGTARDADVARSIGFEFTPEGMETLYLRSRALLAMRTAGVAFPLVGVWQDMSDAEGARRFAEGNRALGYRGQVLIHPSHVAIANDVYGPSESDVAFYRGMVAAFDVALAAGAAAVTYEGQHVDYAHIKTAKHILERHAEITKRTATSPENGRI